MPIKIHGNEYTTVAERLKLATKAIREIYTEVLQFDPKVVVRATVILEDGRKATGISAANINKQIEKESPFEIAETSALGRCLGFLNYGLNDNIASAEEMQKANLISPSPLKQTNSSEIVREPINQEFNHCSVCNAVVKKPYTKCYKCSQKK